MTLTKREKVLAAVVAALVAGLVLWLGYRVFSGPLDLLRARIAASQDKLNTLQDQVIRAKKAQDRLAQWNRQALPSDAARAGALYQSWLLELAGKAGLRQKKVDPGEARGQTSAFRVLPFTVRGQATLDELVNFLYEFYAAGHLHVIRRIAIRPVEKSKDLDLMITIEALSLPTADRADQLSQVKSQRLKLASASDYRKVIGERNVLAPYRPPPPPARPPAPVVIEPKPEPFDPSRFAYVTGIVEVNGEPQVWVKARTTDEKFQLRQGDRFQLGPFSAVIARIDSRHVEIEVDGKRHSVPLGSSVRASSPGGDPPEAHSPANPGAGTAEPGRNEKESGKSGNRPPDFGSRMKNDSRTNGPTMRGSPTESNGAGADPPGFRKSRRSRSESRGGPYRGE